MKNTSIAIADEQELVRQGIILLIQKSTPIQVVCDASNGKDLISKMDKLKQKPNIALIDISTPISDGFETISYIYQNYKDTNCIALSIRSDYETIFNAIDKGAKGYITKYSLPERMIEVIKEVINFGSSYNSFIMNRIMEYHKKKETQINYNKELSRREIEFINHCCSDLGYKQIAIKMDVSPRTIDSFRESVFRKLNIKSRIGIVLFAIHNGLYDPM